MVTEGAIKKNALFLRSISETSDSQKIKNILARSAGSCLKLLVLIVKDFLYKKIPLELTDEEKKKLLRYKAQFRNVAALGTKRTR